MLCALWYFLIVKSNYNMVIILRNFHKVMYCGIWGKCIMGFVRLVFIVLSVTLTLCNIVISYHCNASNCLYLMGLFLITQFYRKIANMCSDLHSWVALMLFRWATVERNKGAKGFSKIKKLAMWFTWCFGIRTGWHKSKEYFGYIDESKISKYKLWQKLR